MRLESVRWLDRMVHMDRTACKESLPKDKSSTKYHADSTTFQVNIFHPLASIPAVVLPAVLVVVFRFLPYKLVSK